VIESQSGHLGRPEPRPGQRFRHFKGNTYTVVGVGLDTATEGAIVIYRPDYPCEIGLFSRPLDEFLGTLERNGTVHIRFEALD
jgi:hypothetical protein